MKEVEVHIGSGRTQVSLYLKDTGRGISILVIGGIEAHIGAVILSLPRQSNKNDGSISCDTYILPVPGHKDYIPAQRVAEKIAKLRNVPVTVCCGIHSDQLSTVEIQIILSNVDAACNNLILRM